MNRPVVGLCAGIEQARAGPWEQTYDLLPRSYSEAVQRAGGLAVLLPADPDFAEDPDEALALIDALVFAGGSDLDSDTYSAPAHAATKASAAPRDEVEVALARRAIERDMPILGICRGMQLLNVAAGGTLVQHLPEAIGHSRHQSKPGEFDEHDVSIAAGSLAARAAGSDRQHVKSHHHQSIARLGDGVLATGWSTDDQLIEAIELPAGQFVLGVLWHPEEDQTSRLIYALVGEARALRRRRVA